MKRAFILLSIICFTVIISSLMLIQPVLLSRRAVATSQATITPTLVTLPERLTNIDYSAYIAEQVVITDVRHVRTGAGIGLNVRACPGMDCAIVTTLESGTAVRVLDYRNGWCEIDQPRGWVDGRYLK